MTTNNPDPLEVWREACGKYEDAYETGDTLRERVILGDQAAAAIIAQHYAPVIAGNERLREALAMAVAEMSRARGRLETIAMCNEDRRIAAALGGTCDFARQALGAKP